MHIDKDLLARFEAGLNPQNLEASPIPATVLGFGEISTVFEIGGDSALAYKRMPLFSDRASAEKYAQQHLEYYGFLKEAGLRLPESETAIMEPSNGPVVLYIAQEQLAPQRFGHKLIHSLDTQDIERLIKGIVSEIAKVRQFNEFRRPRMELALDGQLSNWVCFERGKGLQIYYVDTSTPLYRKDGIEQLDPELFLRSAPFFLRWIIRFLFLDQVMERYYDQRQVYLDLAANLYKEQRPGLVFLTIQVINGALPADLEPITAREVEKYYKEDKLIWTLFLAFRRLDCWIKTNLFRKRYEFILPEKIVR